MTIGYHLKEYSVLRWSVLLPGLLAFSASVLAQNATTPGTVKLMSTFECVSVRASFSGDTDTNNTAAIKFRKSGTTTWLDAYPPVIDRRATVNIQGTANDNSANVNQARGSIVGLTPSTSYDVQVIWSDPGGIAGSASITTTVSTLSYSVPTSGTIRWVDASVASEGDGSSVSPWKTISNAILNSVPGDTIVVKPGTYAPVNITKSGSATGYFVLTTNGTGTVSISGGTNVANGLAVAANYWAIRGFNVAQCSEAGIRIGNGAHDVYIENCTQTNAVSSTSAYTGAFVLAGNNANIFVLSNSFSTFNPTITGSNDGLVNNIDIEGDNSKTIVVAYNTLKGGWDGIGNRNNSGFNALGENSDFCHNNFSDWMDDLIEMDGLGPNVRFFDNHARKTVGGFNGYGGSLLSIAGVYIHPAYVFRNDLKSSAANSIGWKRGHSCYGVLAFHNTTVTAGAGGNETVDDAGDYSFPSQRMIQRNNIFVATGNIFYHVSGAGNDYDYDLCWNNGLSYAGSWDGANYSTLADFQGATKQELHGRAVNPSLNADLTVSGGSPAIDAGVLLPNFNDANSAWPYRGSSPDIGAIESSFGNLPPPAPANLRVVSTR